MAKNQLSVLIPVMNGSQYLDRKIESLKASCSLESNTIAFIVSVNLSSDNSLSKTLSLTKGDRRFKVISQQSRISMLENFQALLNVAEGEFVCFSAVDDYPNDLFFEESIKLLQDNPGIVGVKAKATFSPPVHGPSAVSFSISGSEYERCKMLMKFIRVSHAVNYAVYRRSYLDQFINRFEKGFIGYDWAWGFWMISKGEIVESPSGSIEFTANGVSRDPNVFRLLGTNMLDHVLPYLKLSLSIIKISFEFKTPKTKILLIRFSCYLILGNIKRLILKYRRLH